MEYRFRVEKRTRKEARDMIMAMARYGNHYWERDWGAFRTSQDVERFLAHYGTSLPNLIETCRVKDAGGNPFENRLGSGWTFVAGDSGVGTYTDSEGNEVVRMEESGTMVTATDAALFEKSAEDFERALGSMSYTEYLSCLANGQASIEACISAKAYRHNVKNPGKQLVDNKDHKVPFETKIREWVPAMTGAKLNLGSKNWAHFQRLKKARDTEHTHSKSPALNISYRELCKLMNLFGTGIAGMLLDLHIIFGDTVPSAVVKYAHHPKIVLEVVEEDITPSSGVEHKGAPAR